ncbi:integrase [Nocardia fluminea]|uniref:integrase n=1 Tax=Nocardia fluminea TaxID=134984 RepID=UPI0037FB1C7A
MNPEHEPDPFLLALPTPNSPVVLPHLVGDLNPHHNSRYADLVWSLGALTNNPSAHRVMIDWNRCPPGMLRDELRVAAWTMINGELRPTFIAARRSGLRSRLSCDMTRSSVQEWIRLANWLAEQDISTLACCDTGALHSYGRHLLAASSRSRGATVKILGALTRLWAFDQLSGSPAGIAQPPWDTKGVDDYLPALATSRGENTTEPLSERTLGPLLTWAMRMIDDFADDILAAATERDRMIEVAKTPATPSGWAALHDYLDPLLAVNAPLPAITHLGKTTIARSYIAATIGASGTQIDHFSARINLGEIAAQRPGPCPLNTPITGQIAGKPWRKAVDYGEASDLMRHLGTAAYIVCSYLTGMRPGEVLGLRTGCCPDPDNEGRAGRHLIRGTEYKAATDEHGNHESAGIERDVPWVAISPVVNAIRVLERMVPAGHLLFDHQAHDVHARRTSTGSLKNSGLRRRIEDFVSWANTEAFRHELPHEVIPDDPHGAIGTRRFRRSLAWHIARRPNGLVALAIQYGHMRTIVAGGYGSRARGGIHELIDIETVRAVADTVAELHDDLTAGGGVSGPAARRAIKAAAVAPRFAGTVITATTARRLLANENAMIYDNPHSMLLCHYKRTQALCHRDGMKDTPSLDHCVPGCGNIVRTDGHAAQLRQRADRLDKQATHLPGPLGERLQTTAARLRGYADAHDHSRITLNGPQNLKIAKDQDEPRSR